MTEPDTALAYAVIEGETRTLLVTHFASSVSRELWRIRNNGNRELDGITVLCADGGTPPVRSVPALKWLTAWTERGKA